MLNAHGLFGGEGEVIKKIIIFFSYCLVLYLDMDQVNRLPSEVLNTVIESMGDS